VREYSTYAKHSGIAEIKTVLGGFVIRRFLGGWTLVVKTLGLVGCVPFFALFLSDLIVSRGCIGALAGEGRSPGSRRLLLCEPVYETIQQCQRQ
jgi:hypothetical protein